MYLGIYRNMSLVIIDNICSNYIFLCPGVQCYEPEQQKTGENEKNNNSRPNDYVHNG